MADSTNDERPVFGAGKICETCAFLSQEYECRRHPPKLFVFPDQRSAWTSDEQEGATYFPSVHGSEWCGEWEPAAN